MFYDAFIPHTSEDKEGLTPRRNGFTRVAIETHRLRIELARFGSSIQLHTYAS